MNSSLTSEQELADIRAFVLREIIPYADLYDKEEQTPHELIQKIAQRGYLGAILPEQWGGRGMDMVSLGKLHEAFGYGCSSIRSLLTVHSMVAYAITKWGSREQKATWLPRLASGISIGAFALSEPNVGSDAKSVATTAVLEHDHYVLSGRKTWITYGQIADVFLLFAQLDRRMCAFLVERHAPGLTMLPISGMLGTRAAMLAELRLEGCAVAKNQLVGGIGFGLAPIATSALDIGRYSVACGSVGIAQACLDAVLAYSSVREQGGALLREHQLIQHMVTDMMTNVRAARLLCQQAGKLQDKGDPTSAMETFIAKYFASTIAMKAASAAVQIHGAHGCSSAYPVQRYLRDAKVMEIIEGSSQIQQITVARYGYQQYEQELQAEI